MGLRARLRELAKTGLEHEADEIRQQASEGGRERSPIRLREFAVVHGTIHAVTMPPRRSVPVLVAEVFDGEESVNLVWIGRRTIPGIEPGVFLTARGRVASSRLGPTIFNPAYEIAPRR